MLSWFKSKPKPIEYANPYLDLLGQVMDKGVVSKHQRTGIETRRIVGPQYEFDLSKGWPLIAERKVPYKSMFAEMLWFLRGDTNARTLNTYGSAVWDEWAINEAQARAAIVKLQLLEPGERLDFEGTRAVAVREPGEIRALPTALAPGALGPIYNQMWRRWPGVNGSGTIDQLAAAYHLLKTNPTSRRIIVTGWNPTYLPDEALSPQENVCNGKQALPPCHTLYQFFAEETPIYDRLLQLGNAHSVSLKHVLIETGLGPAFEYLHRGQYANILSHRPPKRPYRSFESLPDDFFQPTLSTRGATKATLLDYADRYLTHHMQVPKHRLSMKLYARSQDLPLGTVFNQAMYSALLIMFAKHLGMTPHRYIHTIGDAHIYGNQYAGVEELLSRPRRPFPTLSILETGGSVWSHSVSDFTPIGYNPDARIKFPIAV